MRSDWRVPDTLVQLARRWARQEELATTFDDLTEGKFAARVLPFIEQV